MSGNFLLDSLLPEDFARLEPQMREVEFGNGDVLYEAEADIDHVYFPRSGLLSVITVLINGDTVETSAVGREGGFGFIEACGAGKVYSRLIVQIPGRGRRVGARAYRDAFDASASFRKTVAQHIELLITEARQEIACHALHPARARLARWLLVCADKTGDPAMEISQEFVATLIAAPRTTVSAAAAGLKELGLIDYSRGRIAIRDFEGLKRRSCECYETMNHFRRRMGQPGGMGSS